MSRLDELINESSKEFQEETKNKNLSEAEQRQKEKEFFFVNMQTPNVDGKCVRCHQEMRIHLSTYICDLCEVKKNE